MTQQETVRGRGIVIAGNASPFGVDYAIEVEREGDAVRADGRMWGQADMLKILSANKTAVLSLDDEHQIEISPLAFSDGKDAWLDFTVLTSASQL